METQTSIKDFLKKNFAILLAFLLPIILIAGIALSAYLPSLFVSTKYNFIYTSCDDANNYRNYNCDLFLSLHYAVVDGKLVVDTSDPNQDFDNNGIPDSKQNFNFRIFLHDTEKNEGREITLEEAQKITLNSLLTSPDGVTVSDRYTYNNGCSDFLFFGGCGSSSYGFYLIKGKGHSKLNLLNTSDRYYYQNNFKFLGWVTPGRN